MRKVKELEERIAKYEKENAALKESYALIEAKLKEYREKEQAIASALTEAQSTAARVLQEADGKVNAILAEAEERQAALDAETDAIREQAAEQAAKIVEDAHHEANRRIQEADDQTKTMRSVAQGFAEQLSKAALEARGWSDRFSQYLKDTSGDLRESFSLPQEQGKGLDALIQDPVELPEDYRTPAELIQNIYKLQGRDIPETAKQPEADAQPEEAEEERVWTVDEVVKAGGEADPQRDAFSVELDAIIDDVLKA
ncbi:MAG: hypothetical protein AAGU74_01480 [Bacillota bacterium]